MPPRSTILAVVLAAVLAGPLARAQIFPNPPAGFVYVADVRERRTGSRGIPGCVGCSGDSEESRSHQATVVGTFDGYRRRLVERRDRRSRCLGASHGPVIKPPCDDATSVPYFSNNTDGSYDGEKMNAGDAFCAGRTLLNCTTCGLDSMEVCDYTSASPTLVVYTRPDATWKGGSDKNLYGPTFHYAVDLEANTCDCWQEDHTRDADDASEDTGFGALEWEFLAFDKRVLALTNSSQYKFCDFNIPYSFDYISITT